MDQPQEAAALPPETWTEALERSRAELAAGQTVSLAPFLAKLDDRIAVAEAPQVKDANAAAVR